MENHQSIPMLSSLIKAKKKEILEDIDSLQRNLKYSHKELFDTLDLPHEDGINVCGINQNQHAIDIKTGELKALVSLYKRSLNVKSKR